MVPFVIQKAFFRFNLSARVGKGQPNKIDDVEYVRFGYTMSKLNTKKNSGRPIPPELLNLNPAGPYGPDLERMIVVSQQARGGTQDGFISPEIDDGRSERYDGIHSWMIVSLSNNVLDMTADIFPRLDLHKLAGKELAKSVRRILLLDPV